MKEYSCSHLLPLIGLAQGNTDQLVRPVCHRKYIIKPLCVLSAIGKNVYIKAVRNLTHRTNGIVAVIVIEKQSSPCSFALKRTSYSGPLNSIFHGLDRTPPIPPAREYIKLMP